VLRLSLGAADPCKRLPKEKGYGRRKYGLERRVLAHEPIYYRFSLPIMAKAEPKFLDRYIGR